MSWGEGTPSYSAEKDYTELQSQLGLKMLLSIQGIVPFFKPFEEIGNKYKYMYSLTIIPIMQQSFSVMAVGIQDLENFLLPFSPK